MTSLVQSVHMKKQRHHMPNSNFTGAKLVFLVVQPMGFAILVQRHATKDMKWYMMEHILLSVIAAYKHVESHVKLAQSVPLTVVAKKASVKSGTSV